MLEPLFINKDFFKWEKEEESIDLIITSPPYNLNRPYNSYEDNLTYGQYLFFSSDWLKKSYSLLKKDGRLCVNVPNATRIEQDLKGMSRPISADIINLAQTIGFKYHATITWNKNNISKRTAWGSWLSASAPYVTSPTEDIIVFFKEQWKKDHKGESTITKKEFIDWTFALWNIAPASAKKVGHPASFPLELPTRLVKLFSYKKELVLDPFGGIGTTAIVSALNDRQAISIELDKTYHQMAIERWAKYKQSFMEEKENGL